MKQMNYTYMECPKSIKGTATSSVIKHHTIKANSTSTVTNEPNYCYLNEVCDIGMNQGDVPNQWYRFILPIFLHAGLLHLFINLSFQIRTGVQMEKDFGTWRILIIYMSSGIFGFVFGANYAGRTTSVGCSGSLYGKIYIIFI